MLPHVNATQENTTADSDNVTLSYTIDQADLNYTGAVKRWLLMAHANITINTTWDGQVPSVTWNPACMGGAVHGDIGMIALAAWPSPSRLDLHVRGGGMSQSVVTYPTTDEDEKLSTEPMVPFHLSAVAQLNAGERMVVELGGSSDELFTWASSTGTLPHSVLRMNVTGDHSFVPMPDAPLACGRGAEAATGSTAGASFYIVEVETGGTITFTSEEASSMWLVAGIDFMETNTYAYDFLGTAGIVDGSVARSSSKPGTSSLMFDQSVGITDRGISWMFVDSDWQLDSMR